MNKTTLIYSICICCLLCLKFSYITGKCFGHECMFSCNCVDGAQCNQTTGECPNGCLQLLPSGYGWGGSACQIGNLAVGRPATQSSTIFSDPQHAASVAVDGDVSPSNYTHTDLQLTVTDHWWEVDLSYPAVIINVTVFNRDISSERLSYFNVRVGNSSAPKTNSLCGYYSSVVPASGTTTVNCPAGMIGRFVSIQLTPNSLPSGGAYFLSLVEVATIGYKYADCPIGFQTSPGCLEPCQDKKFGEFCASDCHCYDKEEVCNKQTGSCPLSGCGLWYTGENCDTYIPVAASPGTPSISATTSSGFQIAWTAPGNIPPSLKQYYMYEVQLKTTGQWTSAVNTNLTAATVNGLTYNTDYQIRILPYRTEGGNREAGAPSAEATMKTNCRQPNKPQKVYIGRSLQTMNDSSSLATAMVQWQKLADYDSGCDNITKYQVNLSERDTGENNIKDIDSTESSVVLENIHWDVQYIIRVAAFNNEQYWSITDEISFKFSQESVGSNPHIGIIIGLSVVIVLLVIWSVTTTVVIWLRRQRNTPNTPTSNGIEKQEFEDSQYEHIKDLTSNNSGGCSESKEGIQLSDYERLRLEKMYENSTNEP